MPSILHVLNGDSTRVTLECAGLPGRLTVWADVLHDGPAPSVASAEEWRRVRARHLASQGFASEEQVAAQLRAWDDELDRFADYDEVVFWLEHDLFDQALLIRHLHWVGQTAERARFRLICVGAFPGRPLFRGLGELNERELASLFPGRRPVSEAEVEVGSRLWDAFRGPDPRPFADLVLQGDTSALPFAAGAFRRHLEDFPHAGSGLSRTEHQMLDAIAAGHTDAAGVFLATQAMEERVYMGDATFWALMRPLVAGRTPILVHDGEFRSDAAPTGIFELTGAAEDVLAGRADHIALNGIDRWMGGTHLTDGHWRWNGESLTGS